MSPQAASSATERSPTPWSSQSGKPAADAAVLKAGGIDLLDLMKEGLLAPRRVVNLRDIPGLDRIVPKRDGGALRIGAMVTLAQLAAHPLVRARYRALADAAGALGQPADPPRRDHRRQPAAAAALLVFPLARITTARARAAMPASPSPARTSTTRSSTTTAAPSCIPRRRRRRWSRSAPSSSWSTQPAQSASCRSKTSSCCPRSTSSARTICKPGEIAHRRPAAAARRARRARCTCKQGEKESFDWPIADVAVVLDMAMTALAAAPSVVLGAAAPVPHRAKAAEAALAGKPIDEAVARAAGAGRAAGRRAAQQQRLQAADLRDAGAPRDPAARPRMKPMNGSHAMITRRRSQRRHCSRPPCSPARAGLALAQAHDHANCPRRARSGGKPLLQALQAAALHPRILRRPLPPQVLSDLLWAAFGINRPAAATAPRPTGATSW